MADGRPGSEIQIFLEDPRWSWQSNVVAAVTDSQGIFRVNAYASTHYILHACNRARISTDFICIEPFPVSAESTFKPLVLSHKGFTMQSGRKQVDEMRKRGTPFEPISVHNGNRQTPGTQTPGSFLICPISNFDRTSAGFESLWIYG